MHERNHCTRALDQPFAQAALAAQPALEPLPSAPVVALVIVAEQVQQAVQREHAQLGQLGVPRASAPAAARRRARSRCRPGRAAIRRRDAGGGGSPAGKLSTSVA